MPVNTPEVMEDKAMPATEAAMEDEPVATDDMSMDDMHEGTPEAGAGDMATEDMSEDDMHDATPVPDTGDMADEAMMEAPAWFNVQLVDVRTGETFTIEDLKGKVILVEAMAMWCPRCLEQQKQLAALHEILGERDDFVSLGLDVDPNENAEALQTYVEENGFDWLYAVAPEEVARELSSLYGDQFLNPSSTPMLVIDRHGEVHPLPFGIKDAESLYEAIRPYLEEGM